MAARSRPVYRIGISGSYGGLNLGDEAILQAITGRLEKSVAAEITIFSRDVKDSMQRYPLYEVIPAGRLTRDEVIPIIEKLDLFILGGGGILFDSWVRQYLRDALLAEEIGVPVMVYAIGAGPLEDPTTQAAVRECVEGAAAVTVRDWSTRHVLERLGVRREIVLTADPALLLEAEPLPPDALGHEGVGGKERLVALSIREPGPAASKIDSGLYHALLANAADFIVDRFDADVVFVSMEPKREDLRQGHAVIAKMHAAGRATVLKQDYSPGQIMTLLGHCVFAVGMRLHFLILAALQRVPFVALPYASKVRSFIEELEMSMPPMQDVTAGQLLAYIDRSWDTRDSLVELIEAGLPRLVSRAETNNEIAVSLLAGARSHSEV